ncbi:MAG: alkaline phosphatase family protein [Acidobacteriota bacterium]
MSPSDVDDLRVQLRERGYLSHGIERWFALDPWRSRAFWMELIAVAGKGAALIALFAVVPLVAVMLFRNHPLTALETLAMSLLYGVTAAAVSFLFLIGVALLLRLRPALAVDTPRALLAISFAAAAILAAPIAVWWYRFDAPPSTPELIAGVLLIALFFVMATIVVSAALLSFSIYELRRVPVLHQKPRGMAMTVAAAVLIALLFIPAYATQEKRASPATPLQVVTTPSERRVALVAVDGLTWEIFGSRPALVNAFRRSNPAPPLEGESTAERWATVGTGVPARVHGVRAIEGIRFRGGAHLLQALSRADFVLHHLAESAGLAQRQPLPPTVRRRDYVWEIFAARGVPSAAVNWWTSETRRDGALDSVGQESVFAAAKGDAAAVDAVAAAHLLASVDRDKPRVATVYLPALDIILNRLPLDPSARLASSVRALDGVAAVVGAMRGRGYDVMLIGLPGDRQAGRAVIADTFLAQNAAPLDLAPTLCALEGFPPSAEMPGRALAGETQRIATYGAREQGQATVKVNQEYYENLKSLGYIR